MRWLVGWSSPAARIPGTSRPSVIPLGARQLWRGEDPLWAVGDWRADEIRVVEADDGPTRPLAAGHEADPRARTATTPARLAVVGTCGASDDDLRIALYTGRGGALRHLTLWPGSYTAVLQIGHRITVVGDLAGARPVFHTPWAGGTAFATAALPLADLVESGLDIVHLAARLACPDAPEALGESTPYQDVRRLPPGHAIVLHKGLPHVTGYEPHASLASGGTRTPADPAGALTGLRDALSGAVRTRLEGPRHVPGPRDTPAPGVGADLSGGSASATLALLAAGLPGAPGVPHGHTTRAGQRLLAVTFNDLATGGDPDRDAELDRARRMAGDPRLRHVVVPGGPESLPYAALPDGPLTDEPAAVLVSAERHRRRLASGGADHLTGLGARHVLDGHPARLADLLLDRNRRHLFGPAAALARAERPSARAAFVPLTVYRAARRLARTPYREGVEDAAARLLSGSVTDPGPGLAGSLAALAWVRPGPAARYLTGEALAEVSLLLRDAAGRRDVPLRPGERRARAALARAAADARVLEQAARVAGQRLHAPYLDNQVVRACQDLPEVLRVRPGARATVLRDVLAASGVRDLPPGWGAPGGAAGAVALNAGLRAARDEILDLFAAPLLGDAGLVDAAAVRHAVASAADGVPLPVDGLAEIVATEVWLHRLLRRRGSVWTGADAPRQAAVAGGVPRGLPARS